MSDPRSWPFEQARALLQRVGPEPRLVTFSTGYGPSGPPHIGTFAEVVRTNMVRNAFREITQDRYPTRLVVFSDDYDAMRRVPDGVPTWMNEYIGLPLTSVADPASRPSTIGPFASERQAEIGAMLLNRTITAPHGRGRGVYEGTYRAIPHVYVGLTDDQVAERSAVLMRAAALIEQNGWFQGENPKNPGSLNAVRALTVAAGGMNAMRDLAAARFREHIQTDMLYAWNDNGGRTKDAVIAAFREASQYRPEPDPPEGRYDITNAVEVFASFADRNNAALLGFIRDAGITDFEFMSSTEQYTSGAFDDALLNVLRNYDAVMDVMLPTLGAERRATYSPFLPRDPDTGRIHQIPMDWSMSETGRAIFRLPNGDGLVTTVLDGNAKLQWKVDWAMRWGVLGVDYEMSGKDLIDSVKASSKIARILGHQPPVSMTYELFLDEEGRKISKSLGNGVSVEDWLQYGTRESLAQFMFQNPRAAKNIHLGLIPTVTDEYLKNLSRINQDQVAGSPESLDNPAWHIHQGNPPAWSSDVSYALLVNLASVSNATEPEVLREYLTTYRSIADEDRPIIDELIPRVIRYCERFVYPSKVLREPSELERLAFGDLLDFLHVQEDGLDGEAYQFYVYEVGKAHYGKERLRDWFRGIYEVIFGSSNGPRFGTFVAAYGRQRTIDLIQSRL